MPSPLDSYAEYAQYIYDLLTDRLTIQHHTLVVYTSGRTLGILRGQVEFHSGYILRVFEHVDFIRHYILNYSYEVFYQNTLVWWYDSMPHPDIPELQSTHPHHKHIEPDIKHHRIPAPGLSFSRPNLSQLIQEIEQQVHNRHDPSPDTQRRKHHDILDYKTF